MGGYWRVLEGIGIHLTNDITLEHSCVSSQKQHKYKCQMQKTSFTIHSVSDPENNENLGHSKCIIILKKTYEVL